ncbi:MAG: hypothetical protein B7733_21180 [Myxococcales bacterium FL481]|nr:MAG: hypothetical protein B7733_21180 [Myxococcales bacterium FL481]
MDRQRRHAGAASQLGLAHHRALTQLPNVVGLAPRLRPCPRLGLGIVALALVRFVGARLVGARLVRARLVRARLVRARLVRARLVRARRLDLGRRQLGRPGGGSWRFVCRLAPLGGCRRRLVHGLFFPRALRNFWCRGHSLGRVGGFDYALSVRCGVESTGKFWLSDT